MRKGGLSGEGRCVLVICDSNSEISVNSQNGDRGFPGEYRLDVEDFGPIVKASVDLRPLTLFIGPSNTGKSYLSILIYALHQCFGDGSFPPHGPPTRRPAIVFYPIVESLLQDDEDSSAMLDQFREWLWIQVDSKSQSKLQSDRAAHTGWPSDWQELETDSLPALPRDVDSYIRVDFERGAEVFRNFAAREIGRYFGVDKVAPLIRRSSSRSDAKVELSIPRKSVPGTVRYGLRLQREGIKFSGEIGGVESLSNEIQRLSTFGTLSFHAKRRAPELIDDYEDLSFIFGDVVEDIFTSLLLPLYRNVHYLPADRTGIMHSPQVVVSTGVLADFSSRLIEIGKELSPSLRRHQPDYPNPVVELATRLENDVLKGAVQLKHAESGYPTFEYLPEGWDENLPLMRASSMVSELAPVVLYLRHLVRPDDILIIEEPESHLHPGMQVEFTRQLAALVRAGVRVIVTTHSEWLLEELANLVRLSQVPDAEREGIDGGDVALDVNQVGAWLFKPDESSGGSTVDEIRLDESGLYPSGFEEVGEALHNKWAAISSRLGDDE